MTKMATWRAVRHLLGVSVALILALPVTGYAQEATVSGTVTDNTGRRSARGRGAGRA